RCRRTALERNLHHAAVHGGGLVLAFDIVAADDVDDDIGTLAGSRLLGNGDEILRLVIHRIVSADLDATTQFLCRAWTQPASFPPEPAVGITRAPNAFASWIAAVPMPDEPPCTRIDSPLRNP